MEAREEVINIQLLAHSDNFALGVQDVVELARYLTSSIEWISLILRHPVFFSPLKRQSIDAVVIQMW